VEVRTTNAGAGHTLPTGLPIHNALSLVSGIDSTGASMPQLSGPVVPSWAGVGDPALGNYAGRAGRAFARIVADSSGVPGVPFWNAAGVSQDDRLVSGQTDTTRYRFALTTLGTVTFRAEFLLRAFFKDLSDAKGWPTDDLMLATAETTLTFPIAATGVAGGSAGSAAPKALALGASYPNPMNPSATIPFDLPEGSPVRLDVFDLSGRLVRTLEAGYLPAGRYARVWDGRDRRGREAASGVYLYRLRAGARVFTRKLVVIR